jgi:hypothetical protein
MSPSTFWLGHIAGLLVLLAFVLTVTMLFGDRQSRGQRVVREYMERLDRHLRFIRSPVEGLHLLIGQAVLGLGVSAYALSQRDVLWLLP